MCRNLYSFVVYLYLSGRGSITSVEEEKAYLSADVTCNYVNSVTCNYVVSVWRGAWDGLRYLFVALPEPFI